MPMMPRAVFRNQPSPGPPRPLDSKTCCKASKASKASKAWKASKALKALDDKTSKASIQASKVRLLRLESKADLL